MIFKAKFMYLNYFIVFLLFLGFNREAQSNPLVTKALEIFANYFYSGEVKEISQTLNIPCDEYRELSKLESTLTKEQLENVCKFSEAMPERIVTYTEDKFSHGMENYLKHDSRYLASDVTYNEDRVATYHDEPNGVSIFVLADGHGGNKISTQLTDLDGGIAPFLDELLKRGYNITTPKILSAASLSYNEALQQSGFVTGGSTCTLLIDRQSENDLIVSSVGDSPCMVFTPQGEILTTNDHNIFNKEEAERVKSVKEKKYSVVEVELTNGKYFAVKKYDHDDSLINISRTFGDGFKLLPVPDVVQIPREQISLAALFSDGLNRNQITTIATESNPDNLSEGINKAFPEKSKTNVGLRLNDDATFLFYNPNIKKE